MTAARRLVISALAGASALALSSDWGPVAAMVGWIVGAGMFTGWDWYTLLRLDGEQSRLHATREDPPSRWVHTSLMLCVAASVVGIGFLLVGANSKGAAARVEAGLGVAVVLVSWLLVHTIYLARYAHRYYEDGGGVDFIGTHDPDYWDFGYLSFTLGMTFQVSDTNVTTARMRRLVLGHCLLSYLLSVVVIAVTINLVVQLASTG